MVVDQAYDENRGLVAMKGLIKMEVVGFEEEVNLWTIYDIDSEYMYSISPEINSCDLTYQPNTGHVCIPGYPLFVDVYRG